MPLPHLQLNDIQRQDLKHLTATGTLPARALCFSSVRVTPLRPSKAVVYWTVHPALHRQNGASFCPLQPPTEPVVYFDERPCSLIGDTVVPLPISKGSPEREHYEYERLGSCVLMVAVYLKEAEPLREGFRGGIRLSRTCRDDPPVVPTGALEAITQRTRFDKTLFGSAPRTR